MSRHRYINGLSVVSGNNSGQASDLADIHSYGYGVAFPFGFSDAATGATSKTTTFSSTWLANVVPTLISTGMQVLWDFSEGPPTDTTWKALNGGNAWDQKNRPPVGLHATIKAMRQSCIDYLNTQYTNAGLVLSDYAVFKDWVEGGKGGANDAYDTASGPGHYSAPYDGYAEGTWDDDLHALLSTVTTGLNLRGCRCIWPSFECSDVTSTATGVVFTQEVSTYGSSAGNTWRTNLTGTGPLSETIIGVNIYPDVSSHPLKGQNKAVYEFSKKLDRVLTLIKAQSWCPASALFHVGEHGWRYSTGIRNDAELARWALACEDVAFSRNDVWGFSHYNIRDDNFGIKTAAGVATGRGAVYAGG